MKDLVLIGAGGHSRACIEVAESMGSYNEIIVIDYRRMVDVDETQAGIRVITGKGWQDTLSKDSEYFVSVGNSEERERIFRLLESKNIQITSLIHKSAIIHKSARLGKGVFIGALSHIGPECIIEKGSIINTLANIEHESAIGAFSHCAPGSVVCGRCKIGRNVMLGAKATMIDGISVADNAVVGAGSVVIHDISQRASVNVGVPTRQI